jgi:hypothetical protein
VNDFLLFLLYYHEQLEGPIHLVAGEVWGDCLEKYRFVTLGVNLILIQCLDTLNASVLLLTVMETYP